MSPTPWSSVRSHPKSILKSNVTTKSEILEEKIYKTYWYAFHASKASRERVRHEMQDPADNGSGNFRL